MPLSDSQSNATISTKEQGCTSYMMSLSDLESSDWLLKKGMSEQFFSLNTRMAEGWWGVKGQASALPELRAQTLSFKIELGFTGRKYPDLY